MKTRTRGADLDEFYVARGPALRRTAYLVVHDWHLAEDMVQTTFTQLWVAWPRIRDGGLDAYARRTLLNACLSHLRRSRREVLRPETPDVPGTAKSERSDLVEALRSLPPRQRAVVALRFLDDLSVSDTADALGIAEGTVKSQTSRALAALRQAIPQHEVDEEVHR